MHKLIILLAAMFTVSLILSASAFALTTDHDAGMNSDGTPKFADPDDQQPQLLNPPKGQEMAEPKNGAPSSSNGPHFSISGGGLGDGQKKQQDPFDHAYSHMGQ